MGNNCGCGDVKFDGMSDGFKRALYIVIAINAIMFLIELPMGFVGQSQALKADALDFFGDTLTYSISLIVIGRALSIRSKAAYFKGLSLLVMGAWIFGGTIYRTFYIQEPSAPIMGSIAFAALAANLISVMLLIKYKDGDANVRSVWLCSRNDALNNIAVIIAAAAVWQFKTPWPDLIVAFIMAGLFLSGALSIIKQARQEMAHGLEVQPTE